MPDTVVLSEHVSNYLNGEDLMLEIGLREGQIVIRLYPPSNPEHTLVSVATAPGSVSNIQAALETALRALP